MNCFSLCKFKRSIKKNVAVGDPEFEPLGKSILKCNIEVVHMGGTDVRGISKQYSRGGCDNTLPRDILVENFVDNSQNALSRGKVNEAVAFIETLEQQAKLYGSLSLLRLPGNWNEITNAGYQYGIYQNNLH